MKVLIGTSFGVAFGIFGIGIPAHQFWPMFTIFIAFGAFCFWVGAKP